jgi:hypothetical protein
MTGENAHMKRDWLQLISNAAIVAGLVVVIVELNQTRNLAFGQMMDGEFAMINDRYLAAMGESPEETLYKAAFDPGTLTGRDAVVLDAHYNSVVWSWYLVIRMMEATGIDRDWRGTVANSARSTFTTEPGRRWLREWAARGSWDVDNPSAYGYSDVWQKIEEVALSAIEESDRDWGFTLEHRYAAILGER